MGEETVRDSDAEMARGLVWASIVAALILILAPVLARAAEAQYPLCPPGGCSVGIPGPYGGGVGVRAAPGRGIQVGVGGRYGGVVGAQVGPGMRVQAGVIPPTYNGWRPVTIPSNPVTIWRPDCMARLQSPRSIWSGVLVAVRDGNGIIATSSHGFSDSEAQQTVAAFSGDKRRFACRLFARDDEADCVLLEIGRPPMRPIAMRGNPPAGTVLRVAGFSGGRPNVRGARCTGVAAPGGIDDSKAVRTVYRWVLFSFEPGNAAQSGDSGGPILDQQGYLRGIVSGVGTGVGTSVIQGLLNQGGPGVGPPATPEPPRPVVQITRDEFDETIAELKDRDQQLAERLMAHSEAIATIKVQLDSGATQGPPGADGKDGTDADPAALTAIEARVAALEAGPLFYSETYINGEFKGRDEVIRGGTLEYHSTLIENAPTDSFRVNTRED